MENQISSTFNFIKLEDTSTEKDIVDFHVTFKLNKTKLTNLMNNLVHNNADPSFFIRTGKEPFNVTPAIVSADNNKKHLYKFFKKIGLYNIVRVTHDSDHYKYYMKDCVGLVYEYITEKKENPLSALSLALYSLYAFVSSPTFKDIQATLTKFKESQDIKVPNAVSLDDERLKGLKQVFMETVERDKAEEPLTVAE